MSQETTVYQPPRTAVFAWWFLGCAALVILLQVIPVGYALVTAEFWVPLTEDEFGRQFEAEDVPAIRAYDLMALVELVGLAAIVAFAALGVRRGRDWGRVLGPAVTAFVLLACTTSNINRVRSEIYLYVWPFWVDLVAYGLLLMYPLLVAGSVLVLLPGSRRHFVPR